MKKRVSLIMLFCLGLGVVGCSRESDKVSYNVSKEADNFNVIRRVAIINIRTDKIEFECIGRISVSTGEEKLEILVEVEKGKYKKHLVKMTEWNMYVVEDLKGAEVDEYKYEINYLPESIIPFKFTNND